MSSGMLKTAKKLTLMSARGVGAYSALRGSKWRTNRLLILGYHGISLQDEAEWRPGLFMSPDTFEERMEALSKLDCTVLPLDEAITRLQERNLPPLSVVITFDDGFHNFIAAAYPVLKRYGFPATVYQTTFYSEWNKPIFNLICPYLLWKASGKVIESGGITGQPGEFDLRTDEGRKSASSEILTFARANKFSPEQKQDLLRKTADAIGVDYQKVSDQKVFTLMSRDELSEMVKSGIDIELHTHRHRVPKEKHLFMKELEDNQRFLAEIGAPKGKHFTYPCGVYRKELFPWLKEFGVRSATTCDSGLVEFRSNLMRLPRFVDTPGVSQLEFEAWVCGLRQFLPGRATEQIGKDGVLI
ncbi:MAG: polysaccharide deacetylase family protein [Candidatus Acidiferrales bacterium]|jgi:peptidoglycan/xylan/chitin deacetylase (PgdA/CDA1 family)